MFTTVLSSEDLLENPSLSMGISTFRYEIPGIYYRNMTIGASQPTISMEIPCDDECIEKVNTFRITDIIHLEITSIDIGYRLDCGVTFFIFVKM